MPRQDQALVPKGGRRKRLIVACDGTWLDSLNGLEKDPSMPLRGRPRDHLTMQMPSNVTRITRAMKSESYEGISQIVYYQGGVGSSNSIVDRVVGGGLGDGLSENVREAYDFLATNYTIGDEIFLLGFSRGAFTARSIAGLIGSIGLLTKTGMRDFYAIFKDYKHENDPDYKPAYPDRPFPNKPSVKDPAYVRELDRRGLTTPNVPVKAVGVWDTVGALGVPRIGWLDSLGLNFPMKELSFDDTVVGEHVENAFQALALDEHRQPFSPAVWEKPRGSRTYLKQVWFPGVHENVGGGNDDTEVADIALAWMMSELHPFIDFSETYILRQHDANVDYYRSRKREVRPWSFGKIVESLSGAYQLAGSKTRTPLAYHRIDPETGQETSSPLRNTHESVHASVRVRYGLDGPGVDDKGRYAPRGLRDFKLIASRGDGGGRAKYVRWEARDGRVLYEDELGEVERRLLGTDPDVYDWLLKPVAKGSER
ncbi:MAG: hypothetical protein M1833_000713 [Piccolia ochrophora]|nr:MAG: hypothetical protein M1833_000713 [Piccolia ochrophora]